MRDINVSDGIVPIGEFKARAAQLLRGLSDTDEPLVITQNGRPAAVMMSPSAFEQLRRKQRLLEAVAAGVHDSESGALVDHEAVASWLRSWGSSNELDPPA